MTPQRPLVSTGTGQARRRRVPALRTFHASCPLTSREPHYRAVLPGLAAYALQPSDGTRALSQRARCPFRTAWLWERDSTRACLMVLRWAEETRPCSQQRAAGLHLWTPKVPILVLLRAPPRVGGSICVYGMNHCPLGTDLLENLPWVLIPRLGAVSLISSC